MRRRSEEGIRCRGFEGGETLGGREENGVEEVEQVEARHAC